MGNVLAVDFIAGVEDILASQLEGDGLLGWLTHLVLEQFLELLPLFDDGVHLFGNAFIVTLFERGLLLLKFRNLVIAFLLDLDDLGIYGCGLLALGDRDFIFQTLLSFLASFLVHVRDNVLSEVQNEVQIAA